MEEKKKVSLTAVMLNCICAIVWDIDLFVAIAFRDTNSMSFVLRGFCAIGWTVAATIWIYRYAKFKKDSKKIDKGV